MPHYHAPDAAGAGTASTGFEGDSNHSPSRATCSPVYALMLLVVAFTAAVTTLNGMHWDARVLKVRWARPPNEPFSRPEGSGMSWLMADRAALVAELVAPAAASAISRGLQ